MQQCCDFQSPFGKLEIVNQYSCASALMMGCGLSRSQPALLFVYGSSSTLSPRLASVRPSLGLLRNCL